MENWELEYPEGHTPPSTGLSKPAGKISKGAEGLIGAVGPLVSGATRNVGRAGFKAAESALGAPADIITGGLGLASLGEQVIGHLGEKIGLKKPEIFSRAHEVARQYLPTTENIRNQREKVARVRGEEFKKFLEPTNGFEESLDNFVDLTASFASPLLGPAREGLKQAAKLAGASGFARWSAEKLGFGETGQAVASAGAMLATTIAGKPSIAKRAGELYDKAKMAVRNPSQSEIENILKDMGKNAPIDRATIGIKDIGSEKIERGIATSLGGMELGLDNAAKDIARKHIEKIQGKFNPSNKRIALNDLAQTKQDINANIYKSSNVAENKAAEQYLKPVKDALIETIKDSAKDHPEFANNLLEADELWSAIKEQDAVSKFLQARVKFDVNEFKSPLTASLLTGLAGAAITPFEPTTGKLLGLGSLYLGGYSAYKSARIFMKSPRAREAYADIIKSSLKKNVPQTLRDIRKIDHIFSIEDNEAGSDNDQWELEFPSQS